MASGHRLLASGHLRRRGHHLPARGVLGGHRGRRPRLPSTPHRVPHIIESPEQPLPAPLLPANPGSDRRRPRGSGLRAAGVFHRLVDDLAAGLRARLVAVPLPVGRDQLLDAGFDEPAGPRRRLLEQLRVDPGDLPALPVGPLDPHHVRQIRQDRLQRPVVGGGHRVLDRPKRAPVHRIDPPVGQPDPVDDPDVGVQLRLPVAVRVVREQHPREPGRLLPGPGGAARRRRTAVPAGLRPRHVGLSGADRDPHRLVVGLPHPLRQLQIPRRHQRRVVHRNALDRRKRHVVVGGVGLRVPRGRDLDLPTPLHRRVRLGLERRVHPLREGLIGPRLRPQVDRVIPGRVLPLRRREPQLPEDRP